MKKLFLSLIVIALFFSCKDDYEKANEDIKGTWKFESMQYQISYFPIIPTISYKLFFE